MVYLIFYDISTDRLRNKISKLLESMGYERLQLSVFTGLDNPVKNPYLWERIQKILFNEPEAKLFVLPINSEQFCAMKGVGVDQVDLLYLAGMRSSLIV